MRRDVGISRDPYGEGLRLDPGSVFGRTGPGSLVVNVRHWLRGRAAARCSKTDQEGQGAEVAILRGCRQRLGGATEAARCGLARRGRAGASDGKDDARHPKHQQQQRCCEDDQEDGVNQGGWLVIQSVSQRNRSLTLAARP